MTHDLFTCKARAVAMERSAAAAAKMAATRGGGGAACMPAPHLPALINAPTQLPYLVCDALLRLLDQRLLELQR